jgi:hypothetical protein
MRLQSPDFVREVFLFAGVAACATTGKPNLPHEDAIPRFNRDSLTTALTGQRLYALVGAVVDSASGRPLRRAIVTAALDTIEKPAFTLTDDSGGFVIGRLRPGHYRILVRQVGYTPFNSRRDGIAGKIDTVRVRLQSNPYREMPTADKNNAQSCFASDTVSVRIIGRLQTPRQPNRRECHAFKVARHTVTNTHRLRRMNEDHLLTDRMLERCTNAQRQYYWF